MTTNQCRARARATSADGWRRRLAAAGAGSIVAGGLGLGIARSAGPAAAAAASATPSLGALHSVRFEANAGQTDGSVRFLARNAGYPLYLTANDAVFVLAHEQSAQAATGASTSPSSRSATAAAGSDVPDSVSGAVIRLHMVGANPNPQVTGVDALPGVTNYFNGHDPKAWIRGVVSYAGVRYHDVYPGIDLVYHANSTGDGVEYDYVLAPGVDPSAIAVDVQGADSVAPDSAGGLSINTAGGQLVQHTPDIYQEIGGSKKKVSGGYKVSGGKRVGFSVGAHDPTKPLVVDPALSYLTYLGGALGQFGGSPAAGIAVDATGHAYVAGQTFAPDFPTTTGAFQTKKLGDPTKFNFLNTLQAYVTKLSPDGSSLVYSTYLGGTGPGFFGGDSGTAIAIDSAGDAVVVGTTNSPDFPTTPGTAYQQNEPAPLPACGRCFAAFVTELNASGSNLRYSTYLGSPTAGVSNFGAEGAKAVAVDGSGRIYVTGTGQIGFPTTPTAFQTGCASGCPTNNDGSSTTGSSTYTSPGAFFTPNDLNSGISGTNIPAGAVVQSVDSTTSITLGDGGGNPVLATGTGTGLTFTLARRTFGVAFLSKIDPTAAGAASLVYSTLLGSGSEQNVGNGVAVDGTGMAYVAGQTTAFDFPTTPGALQTRCAECHTISDGVANGSTTFTSASANFQPSEVGESIYGTDIPPNTTIASVGNVSTVTLSNAATASGTGLRFTLGFRGDTTGFVAKVDPTKSGAASLVYSTFLGGGGDHSSGITSSGAGAGDAATALAVEPATGRAYVTGYSDSGDFPTTAGAADRNCVTAGSCDASRTFTDGVTTTGSTTLTSATGGFSIADTGIGISGAGIPAGSSIVTFVTSTTVILSNPATASGTNTYTVAVGAQTDGFASELDAAGRSLVASTYLGGPLGLRGIALDPAGHVHVAGAVSGATGPSVDPIAAFTGGPNVVVPQHPNDGSVMELDGSLSSIVYATPLGGNNGDALSGVAVDPGGAVYVAGTTTSPDLPTTPGAFRTTWPGRASAWIAKISPVSPAAPLVTAISPTSGPTGGGTTVTLTGHGFSSTTAVTFGGVPAASWQVDSTTHITAVSPSQGPNVPYAAIQVTTASGTSPANPIDRFGLGEGLWTESAPLDADRDGPFATLLNNGKVLVAGGANPTRQGNPVNKPVQIFDPLTGTWTPGATPPYAWSGDSATRLADGRVLHVGAMFGTPSAEIYDPVADSWTVVAAPTDDHSFGTVTLLQNGQVLAVGGFSPGYNATTEIYDVPTNTWTTIASPIPDLPGFLEFWGATATLLPDGTVLFAGGCCTSGFGVRPDAEIFDTKRREWLPTGAMSSARFGHTATLLANGKVLVTGGSQVSDSLALASEELYDPTTGKWSLTGLRNQGSEGAVATTLQSGKVLIAGGTVDVADVTAGPLAAVDLYDPANPGAARNAMPLIDPRGELTGRAGDRSLQAVLISSSTTSFQADPAVCGTNCGKVLIVGGLHGIATGLYTPPPAITGVSPSSGTAAGGTTVTITGAGFNNLETPIVTFGGVPATSVHVDSYSQITAVTPATSAGTVDVVVRNAAGPSATATADAFTFIAVPVPVPAAAGGYWLVASDGGIFPFGAAGGFGSTGGVRLNKPIVGMAATPDGGGYWLVAADGGIFPFGDATGYGSTGAIRLNKPIVGMASTPDGGGYWLVAADGGIFPFGDAVGYGSTGAIRLNKPIVGMASTPDGGGYWLVAADGGIFPFGDATGHGSTGAIHLNKPVVGMAATRDGGGYWLVAADGGIFPFGDAAGHGSTGAIRLNKPMVGMAATHDGGGYWLVAADGGIFPFGDAAGLGSTGGTRLNQPIVGMAAKG